MTAAQLGQMLLAENQNLAAEIDSLKLALEESEARVFEIDQRAAGSEDKARALNGKVAHFEAALRALENDAATAEATISNLREKLRHNKREYEESSRRHVDSARMVSLVGVREGWGQLVCSAHERTCCVSSRLQHGRSSDVGGTSKEDGIGYDDGDGKLETIALLRSRLAEAERRSRLAEDKVTIITPVFLCFYISLF